MKDHQKAAAGKASSSHHHHHHHHHQRKSRWESGNPPPDSAPSPKPSPAIASASSASKHPPNPNPNLNPNPNPNPNLNTNPKPNPTNPNTNPNSNPNINPNPNPNSNSHPHSHPSPYPHPHTEALPPPPTYGFHMLERRTIVLADGSVRSYFALPPDYSDIPNDPPPDYWIPRTDFSHKRKYDDDHHPQPQPHPHDRHIDRDDFLRLQYSSMPPSDPGTSAAHRDPDPSRPAKHPRFRPDLYDDLPPSRKPDDSRTSDINPQLLQRAFLQYVKSLNETSAQRKNFLENGKFGALHCLVCDRNSKDYTDVHGLIMHAYNSQSARVEHLGFHKALCVLMGWNYMRAPDNSKAYRQLPEAEAAANRDDLVIWPPVVLIQNTCTGKKKDGRMDGMGNKEMDNKLKELGFTGGKSKSMYGKDGHMGVTMVKFANSRAGLEEAERLAVYFEKDNRGRKAWARVQASQSGDGENNPYLVKVDVKTGEKKRVLYGYLGSASDLEKVDFDTKKKALIKSRRELDVSW